MLWKRKRRAFRTATPVRKLRRRDVSVTGFVYISMMLFMGLAAINSQANLLFGVFGLMIGVLLISGVISRVILSKLAITRTLPENGIVGRRATISYEIENRKRFWPTLSVSISELDGVEAFTKQPNGYLLHIAPGQSTFVPVEVVPKRRGVHSLRSCQISTSFPFGFIMRSLEKRVEDRLLVFPAMTPVDSRLLSIMRSAESSTTSMRPRRGGMDEFYGLKEFRTGENPRWIYWKRSARTGTLIAKEMTHVSPPKILLAVDSFVPPTADHSAFAAVERCIAMAASLANHAIDQGLPVGLLAWSGEWISISPNRGKRQKRDLLTALARLPLNREHNVRELLEQSFDHQAPDTTTAIFSPSEMQMSLGEHVRGGVVVIAASNPQSRQWFKFDPVIDFDCSMPLEQEESIRLDA